MDQLQVQDVNRRINELEFRILHLDAGCFSETLESVPELPADASVSDVAAAVNRLLRTLKNAGWMGGERT